MHYIIDGHNLIGQMPDLSLDDPDDEAKLVQRLISFTARTKSRCTVIFDRGVPGGKSRMSTGKVRVIFASQKEDADSIIMRRIFKEKNPRLWTVVSGDHRVLNTAKRGGMAAIKSVDFVAMMRRPPAPPKPDRGTAPDVKLTDDEIAEWLALFNGGDEK